MITPGMPFMASSMGRVIVAIISLAGMMPLFTSTTTRGKSVRGKTDDGVCNAEKIPARHRISRDERDGNRVPRGELAQVVEACDFIAPGPEVGFVAAASAGGAIQNADLCFVRQPIGADRHHGVAFLQSRRRRPPPSRFHGNRFAPAFGSPRPR